MDLCGFPVVSTGISPEFHLNIELGTVRYGAVRLRFWSPRPWRCDTRSLTGSQRRLPRLSPAPLLFALFVVFTEGIRL